MRSLLFALALLLAPVVALAGECPTGSVDNIIPLAEEMSAKYETSTEVVILTQEETDTFIASLVAGGIVNTPTGLEQVAVVWFANNPIAANVFAYDAGGCYLVRGTFLLSTVNPILEEMGLEPIGVEDDDQE